MSVAYTTVDKVRGLCRLITPDSFGQAQVDQAIADAGTEIDTLLRGFYAPQSSSAPHLFTDTAGSPSTHPYIEKIARHLAAAEVLETWYSSRQLDEDGEGQEQPRYRTYRAKAARWLRLLMGTEPNTPRIVLEGYSATQQTSETASASAGNILTNHEPDSDTDSGFAVGTLRDEVSRWES